MNTAVDFVHLLHKNVAYLDNNFDGIDGVLMRKS